MLTQTGVMNRREMDTLVGPSSYRMARVEGNKSQMLNVVFTSNIYYVLYEGITLNVSGKYIILRQEWN